MPDPIPDSDKPDPMPEPVPPVRSRVEGTVRFVYPEDPELGDEPVEPPVEDPDDEISDDPGLGQGIEKKLTLSRTLVSLTLFSVAISVPCETT